MARGDAVTIDETTLVSSSAESAEGGLYECGVTVSRPPIGHLTWLRRTRASATWQMLAQAAAFAMVFAAVLLFYFPRPNPRINQPNYQRLEIGISRVQVEAILGKPCGRLGSAGTAWEAVERVHRITTHWDILQPPADSVLWVGKGAAIAVYFDASDQVVWHWWLRPAEIGPPTVESIRQTFSQIWRDWLR